MYKVLCVDDEPNILQYLPVAIDWENFGIRDIRTASGGKEALRILEEVKPDIAIVDVEMPDLNGLDFCRRAAAIKPDLKMVILSAFDRFDYAKRAIGIGVEEYILKPVDESELEQAISKIVSDIEKDRREGRDREQLVIKALEKEVNEMMHCFVQDKKYESDLEYSFPFLKEYHNFCIAVRKVGEQGEYAGEMKNILYSDEIVLSLESGFLGIFWKKDDRVSMREELNRFREKAQARGIHLRFFYGRKKLGESFEQVVRGCFYAMEFAFYSSEKDIEASMGENRFLKTELKAPELKEALNLLSEEGDITQLAEDILGEVQAAFDRQAEPLAVCRMVLDIFITLKIYLTKYWQEQSLGVFRKMSLWSFIRCGSQKILREMIEENLNELQVFIKVQKETHGNLYIVRMAKNYTKEHYQDAGLSLQEVADAVGISRTYFSSIFKELTGEKYWNYLSRCRIEKAKVLLKETGLSQSEISERVGYNSEYHFSRKFKELTGISPNKFRKK